MCFVRVRPMEKYNFVASLWWETRPGWLHSTILNTALKKWLFPSSFCQSLCLKKSMFVCVLISAHFLGGKGIKCCSAFLINDLVPWGIWWDLLAKECHGIPHLYFWRTKSGTPAILNPRSPRAGGRGSGHIALQSPHSLSPTPTPQGCVLLHSNMTCTTHSEPMPELPSLTLLAAAENSQSTGNGHLPSLSLSSLISIQSNAMPLFS